MPLSIVSPSSELLVRVAEAIGWRNLDEEAFSSLLAWLENRGRDDLVEHFTLRVTGLSHETIRERTAALHRMRDLSELIDTVEGGDQFIPERTGIAERILLIDKGRSERLLRQWTTPEEVMFMHPDDGTALHFETGEITTLLVFVWEEGIRAAVQDIFEAR